MNAGASATTSTAAPRVAPSAVDSDGCPALHDLSCVVHVHSTYSDGTAGVEELIEHAARCGHDAVLLTDHDTLGAKRDGWEGWHGSVLLLVGTEVSPAGGHYLAFGLDREIAHEGLTEAEIPAAVEAAGGFGFAAHPFSEGSRMATRLRLKNVGSPHGWPDADRPGLAGIELWSVTTDAAEAWRHPLDAIGYLRDPEGHLDGPPAHHLACWDRLCGSRRVVAIGGLDAHQHGVSVGGRLLSPMPHGRYFDLLATYVQCRQPASGALEGDRAAVYDALREGRCYLGVDAIAPARGFRFWGEGPDEGVLIGEEREAVPLVLRASLPERARIALLKDGEPLYERTGNRLERAVDEPGVYRIEARRTFRGRERPWIISNPIYLR